MAFWGAPLDDPQHAVHAVQAGIEMAQVLEQFKQELGRQERLNLEVDLKI
jgi:adenylate cyclase